MGSGIKGCAKLFELMIRGLFTVSFGRKGWTIFCAPMSIDVMTRLDSTGRETWFHLGYLELTIDYLCMVTWLAGTSGPTAGQSETGSGSRDIVSTNERPVLPGCQQCQCPCLPVLERQSTSAAAPLSYEFNKFFNLCICISYICWSRLF